MRVAYFGTALSVLGLSAPAAADTLATGAVADTFDLAPVASNLTQPTSIDWLPDGRMLITEKGGNLILVDRSAGDGGEQRVIGTFPVDSTSEKGLLHVLVHPDFVTNRRLIFYYSASAAAGGTNADRHRVVTVPLGDDDQLDLTQERILIRGLLGPANHDGGALAIGPDGKLYVGVGDTGCNSSRPPEPITPPGNYFATCFSNPNGKILRVNLDGTIPSDNPLVGKQATACGVRCNDAPPGDVAAAREDVWAWGFRNPWRFSFDARTGNLWVGDVGEVAYEEVNVIPPNGGGKHYGWPWREGARGNAPEKCTEITPDVGNCVDPQYYCAHAGRPTLPEAGNIDGDCRSITGGVIVDSCQFPDEYRGKYFFGDASRAWVSTLTPTADRNGIDGTSREKLITVAGSPVDFAVGPDGALYYVALGGGADGTVQRLFPKVPRACPLVPEAGVAPDAGADANVDASEPGAGGASSTGGTSGNSGGQSSGGRSSGGGAPRDGGGGAAGADDDGCDCRIGGRGTPGGAGVAGLALAVALVASRRRKRR